MQADIATRPQSPPDRAIRRSNARRAQSEPRRGTLAQPLLLETATAEEITEGVGDGSLDLEAVACDHLRRLRLVDPVLNAVARWIEDPTAAARADGLLAGRPVVGQGSVPCSGNPIHARADTPP